MFLLVRQDLFDRTVNAKGMKTKDSQETVKAYYSMITKKNGPKNIWVDKGTEFAGAFKKFRAAEGIQVYSTMSETKAAFAERTIRSLKKNSLPLHGGFWVPVYTQIISVFYHLKL